MGVNAGAYRVIARSLAVFRDADEHLPQAA
jgi:hypothetical protein